MGLGDSFAVRFFIEGLKPEVVREVRVSRGILVKKVMRLRKIREEQV